MTIEYDSAGALRRLGDLAARAPDMGADEVRSTLLGMMAPEVVIALGCCDPSQTLQPLETLAQIRGLGAMVRRFQATIRRERRANPPELRVVQPGEQQSVAAILERWGCPWTPDDDYSIPDGWAVDAGRTHKLKRTLEGDEERVIIARGMILPIARSRDDESGDHTITLVWSYCGRWSTRTVERRVLLTRDPLLGLANLGAPVEQQTATMLTAFLAACDAALATPVGTSLSRMGWTEDGTAYLWGARAIGDAAALVAPADGEQATADRYGASGSMQEWLEQVWMPCAGRPAEVVVLASLAAPLLHVIGAQGWTLDIGGPRGSGKTTSQIAAASCWGPPSTITPWPRTWAGMRSTAEFCADLPTILDDTKHAFATVQGARMVKDLLYQVAGERSQVLGSRGGGTRQSRRMRTLVISSGEAPIAEYLQDAQGASQRILTLDQSPFPPGRRSMVQGIERAARQHYGHAGPALVRHLIERREEWADLRRRYVAHVDRRAEEGGTDDAGRLALRLAVLDLAAEVAEEALGIRVSASALDTFAAHVLEGTIERDAPTEALHHVVGHLASHPAQVDGWGWSPHTGQQCIGGTVGHDRLAIRPSTCNELLESGGYNPREIRRQWADRGWLQTSQDASGRGRSTTSARVAGRATQHVVILDHALSMVIR